MAAAAQAAGGAAAGPAALAPMQPPPFPAPQLTAGQMERSSNNYLVLTSLQTRRTWQIVRELRECIYGSVQLAIEFTAQQDGSVRYAERHSAIKVIQMDRVRRAFPEDGTRPRTNEDPIKEIAVMQYLASNGAHDNVLSLDEALQDRNAIYLVLPYCDGGELFDVVAESGRFTEEQARPLFRQLLQGLSYLQARGVSHRDMSLENILVADASLVIIDFGMALRCPQTPGGEWAPLLRQGQCGKRNYMSPEVWVNRSFNGFAIDIWACGIILFIMLTGVPPFDRADPSDARFRMIAVERRLAELLAMWNINMSPEAVDILQRMLIYEPHQRATVVQLAAHAWILQELH